MAERAALFFFSRAELLSTRYCVRPGTDCFPLVFLVSEGRTSQSIFLLAPELEIRLRRAREHGVLAVPFVLWSRFRPTRNNHGRSGPLPTSRTTTTVGNGSHPIHTAGTAQPQRPTATDRVGEPPLHSSGYFLFVESPSGVVGRCRGRGRTKNKTPTLTVRVPFPPGEPRGLLVGGGTGPNTPGRICCLPAPSSFGRAAAATDRTNDREKKNEKRVRPYPSFNHFLHSVQ